jgi:hypothetical protein
VPPLIVAVTTLFAVIGAAISWPWWRRALAIVRVHRDGVAAEAKVLEVAPAGLVVNRVQQWRLRYEFRDRAGQLRTGTSDYLTPVQASEWHVGDKGAVRYHREQSTDSVWLGRER